MSMTSNRDSEQQSWLMNYVSLVKLCLPCSGGGRELRPPGHRGLQQFPLKQRHCHWNSLRRGRGRRQGPKGRQGGIPQEVLNYRVTQQDSKILPLTEFCGIMAASEPLLLLLFLQYGGRSQI